MDDLPVQQDLKTMESRYGDDVLHLMIASGYLSKLVKNRDIKWYLFESTPSGDSHRVGRHHLCHVSRSDWGQRLSPSLTKSGLVEPPAYHIGDRIGPAEADLANARVANGRRSRCSQRYPPKSQSVTDY